MKVGARNQLTGTVRAVKKGDVMSQVELEITAPSSMQSVMTTDSLEDLGLQPGDRVRIIVKAIHVLIVRD